MNQGLTGARATLFKVFADQSTMLPLWTVIFFIHQATLEGVDWEETKKRVDAGFANMVLDGLTFYVPVHLVTFSVIPVQHRI